MNETTKKFIKESGIERVDKDFLSLPNTGIRIYMNMSEDCTPAELLGKIIHAAKSRRSLEIFSLLTTP